ncbi:hypothetical protein MTBBW1_1370003 [Desulfamplus magnetovallimortis]|uniref:Uncharacterized protein n=1 Tax=Desulfamplus magnetovallimortis TaxID=1246637 RepID=A0A1W1H7K2_9BACT|nr:hypothetical protein MTBBW1_1370003 [Desulfamplus magnetovallimortis]
MIQNLIFNNILNFNYNEEVYYALRKCFGIESVFCFYCFSEQLAGLRSKHG